MATEKVAIVYSDTTAALYFGLPASQAITAYDDLFMDAQQQARAAGVSYDIIDESQLATLTPAQLQQYSALIFPDFQYVQSTQAAAITTLLTNAHVPIITSGNFMTNDQAGNPITAINPLNPYAGMESLLNLQPTGANTATYQVNPNPTALASNNPILAGYTAGEMIGGASGEFAGTTQGFYTNAGYLTFAGFGTGTTTTTLADVNIGAPGTTPTATVPGVIQATNAGVTNTDFSTTGLFGDSNLLQHVIQNTVFGTTPSLAIDITRFKGIVNSRTDMDQSQFPSNVSPASGPGIYTEMLPILQTLKQQYNFVGSYFINIGDNPAAGDTTNWAVSAPIYKQLIAMGNEIGNHSYTHLINPPTTTVPETTTVDSPLGSTQVTLSALPSFNGVTLGMTVTGPGIGLNAAISGISGNTITLTAANTADVPPNSTLTFGVPTENTNFLSTVGTVPFTYNYEFGQSKTIEQTNLGITIAGAAVPGAPEFASTSDQIEQYNLTANLPAGLTGYVNGGWTGVGSGAPNAFGYIDPNDQGSVYIAPNIPFDFTEIAVEGKTAAQALQSWENLFNQVSSNSETPIVVWPWHDYGITDFPTGGPPAGYTQAMYTNFVAYAYNAGYEFVTSEDLASRIAAEQAATVSETTTGNVITATVTPGAGKPDLGAMALNVINGAAGQVIQNAGSWYAYDSNSVFLPYGASASTYTVTLGTTQDDVTHIDSLPMRADLKSVTGNGTNLTFSMTGDGVVDLHIKTPGTGRNVVSVQGLPATATATLNGDDLQLAFNDGSLAISSTSPVGVPVLHTVTITEGTSSIAGATNFVTGPPGITPPVPTQTDAVIQNSTTAQVDYLQYQGSTLVGSNLVDYGLGASYKIVGHGDFNGDGHQDLVAQNPATGAVDFLFLDANAHLVGSALSSTALPKIVGGGNFGSATGQTGPTLVAQLANGELDMLGFNSAGKLVASDAISNTIGFAPVVGVGEGAANIPSFAGVGSTNDNVVLQLANGSLDAIGFSGSFANASLTMSSSFLSPSNPGVNVSAINQGAGGNTNQNVSNGSGLEGVQMLSQLSNGSIDALYFDSGYNNSAQQGTMYASNLLSGSYSGWNVVDAGSVAHNDLFPIA
jgi:hypothetical protein